MNDTTKFFNYLKKHGCVTLGQIMKTRFACQYRKHASLIRAMGHSVKVIIDREKPSNNLYVLKINEKAIS